MTLYQGVAVLSVLFAVYCLAKAFSWFLESFGPDARARRGEYAESANRVLVKSRMRPRPPAPPLHLTVTGDPEQSAAIEKLLEQTKTRPGA